MAASEATVKRNVLIAALVLGLATSVLIAFYLRSTKEASEPEKTWLAVVATRDIPARTIIGQEMVEEQRLTKLESPEDVVWNKTEVLDSVALQEIPSGTPIRRQMVATKGISLGLSFTIPRTMRAVTVGVDEVVGVAGFLKPGDYVDVLATHQSGRNYIGRTVVQDVRLLALGTQLENERVAEDGRKPGLSGKGTATLLVTPSQAEALVLAENRGKLRLTLRAAGDHSRAATIGAKISTGEPASVAVTSSPRPAPPAPRPAPYPIAANPYALAASPLTAPALPAVYQLDKRPEVEVIRGSEVERVKVDRYR